MEIINKGLSPLLRPTSLAGRGLASPKTSVGVWLLVLIVFLLVVPVVLGHIACIWCGFGVGVRGRAEEWAFVTVGGVSAFVLAYIRKDTNG